jgi:hypothetical protein
MFVAYFDQILFYNKLKRNSLKSCNAFSFLRTHQFCISEKSHKTHRECIGVTLNRIDNNIIYPYKWDDYFQVSYINKRK